MAVSPSKKRKKIIVFTLIILGLAVLGGIAFFKNKEPIIIVQQEKVTRRDLTELVVANGKIQPVVQVKISPEVSGEIMELPVKEGQTVKKGDLLVSIRPDNYLATRDSSLANYKLSLANSNNAAANLEKAALEYERNQKLFKHKLISDSDFLTAKTTYDMAAASLAGAGEQVSMAAAALQSSESDLKKAKIYSPLDGRITKLSSQVGERVVGTAMMAGTEIMTVSDLNEMEARVDVGEIDVTLMAVGQAVRLEVDAFKDRKFKGEVTDIANSAKNNDAGNAATASATTQDATKFTIKIRVKEKEFFRPGMSVTAEIETRSRTNVLTVPIQSVTTRLPKDMAAKPGQPASTSPDPKDHKEPKSGDKKKTTETAKPIEVVFVVDSDHVRMEPIKRGIQDDNYMEITKGLKEGDMVVSGSSKAINRDLEDGRKITIGTPLKTTE